MAFICFCPFYSRASQVHPTNCPQLTMQRFPEPLGGKNSSQTVAFQRGRDSIDTVFISRGGGVKANDTSAWL
jgi:hypothetical protein